ncbi:MAG TPA: sulfite exporter TauE/SafE family protein [Candidatus Kapabacteria bacterium]
MDTLWIAVVTGFLSSLHCIGMCGPIVVGYVSQRPVQISMPGGATSSILRVSSIAPQLVYNLGRVISYSLIGALAGFLGATTLISRNIQDVVSIVLGSIMILFALAQLGVFRRLVKRTGRKERKGIITNFLSGVTRSGGLDSRLILGLMTPLLPCGLLYGMAAVAAATLSPITGAATMGAFAIGSIPALVAAGMLSGVIGSRIRLFGTRFAVVLLIIMGILTIGRGAGFYKGGALFQSEEEPCCKVESHTR